VEKWRIYNNDRHLNIYQIKVSVVDNSDNGLNHIFIIQIIQTKEQILNRNGYPRSSQSQTQSSINNYC